MENYSSRIWRLFFHPSEQKILYYLRSENQEELRELYRFADWIRELYVGDEVHLRGIVEFSNYCKRKCLYCGINAMNGKTRRFRMTNEEIIENALRAWDLGFKTIVLQSGEDDFYRIEDYEEILKRVKQNTGLAITLSIGEKSAEEYERLFMAGADRYLLKHETSDIKLYSYLNPGMTLENRLKCLKELKRIGYEAGSGIMIGLPDQSLESVARDIMLFKELDTDMMGCGPFIPHPSTPLEVDNPGKEDITYRVLALNRIVTRDTNLPSTTALSTVNETDAREKALKRGANVIMPNLTPMPFREYYDIYPNKKRIEVNTSQFIQELKTLIEGLGRKISMSPGNREKKPKLPDDLSKYKARYE